MITIDYAYRRFSKKRFPLPSEAQLEALEESIGVTFPDDYRRFILEFNGGYFINPEITPVDDECPLVTLEYLCGIGASHPIAELGSLRSLAIFDDNNPPKIVPIGATGMGGLIILMTEPDIAGAILLKQAFGDFYHLTDGIEEFFELLREPTWD